MKIQNVGSLNIGINADRRQKPSFKRSLSEHASWGANYIKKTGKTNFKLFSFPDAKAVFVEVGKNAERGFGNIKERVVQVFATAGTVFTVTGIKSKDDDSAVYPMEHKGKGVYEANGVDAAPEDNYRYIIVDKDNNINLVKDPYSKDQKDINGWSSIYNPDNYEWKSTDWLAGNDPRRIIRKPQERLRGLENLIVEEINIPTLTQEGTFESAKSKIKEIADTGIATAVEILPVENTFSMQWGYDGVDKFAVNEKLGGVVKLKELIDYAHENGLNVIMDMVPNHMGPDGDYLVQTGPYEKGPGEFGGELNYEGQNNLYVRDWMTNAALWWAGEFKVDGIRLDMTKYCRSDYLLKQIVTEVNEHYPNVFIIAEDGRNNNEAVTRYETRQGGHEERLDFIDTQVEYIAGKGWETSPVNIGFDSEWDFELMHTLKKAVLVSDSDVLSDLDDRLKASQYRVKYVMSHDEIGNEDGTRLIPKVLVRQLDLFIKSNGNSDTEKGQRAAQIGQKLTEFIVSEEFQTISESDLLRKEKEWGLNTFIDKSALTDAFKTAFAKQKLALGTIMTIPGPKMYFQGDEKADLAYFKFFREFSGEKGDRVRYPDYAQDIINRKGYDTLEEIARPESVIGRIKPDGMFCETTEQMKNFMLDLKNITNENSGLRCGEITDTYKDYSHNVHIHKLTHDNDEWLIIKNFGQKFHEKEYCYYGFPKYGVWEEIFNSDEEKYGGAGYTNKDRDDITNEKQNLSMAPNSLIILKKTK